ncbi:hypothetical protein [Alkalihalobacillus sp. BA299]|nr:hypothetical protein [Alkalihalobacillus sp. BA299]
MYKFFEQLTAFFIALFELEYEHLLYDDSLSEEHIDTSAKI